MKFVHDQYDLIMNEFLAKRAEMDEKTKGRLIGKEIVKWGPLGRSSIWIEYDDGSKEEYSHYDGYTRNMRNRDPLDIQSVKSDFSRKLYELMKSQGFTQAELAAESGISQGSISGYLAGTSSPSLVNLRKLAKTLNCRVIELIETY